MRLKFGNVAVKLTHLVGRDIGRIAHHEVERVPVCVGNRLERRADDAPIAVTESQAFGVAVRHVDRCRGHIDRDRLRGGYFVQQRQRDAARAAAQVEHTRALHRAHPLDGQLAQALGVAARDEHVGRDAQRDAVEVPLAQHVGQRFTRQAASNQRLGLLALGRGHRTRAQRGQQTAIQPQRTRGQLTRFQIRHRNLFGSGFVQLVPNVREQCFYVFHLSHFHASLSSGGMTFSMDAIATSIMLSSGSNTVSFCIWIPGQRMARLMTPSCRPAQRLHS